MSIHVRQATLKDKDAIWSFIRRVYEQESAGGSSFKLPERWIWQFIINPFINETDDRLPIWLALDNNEIVGQYCALPSIMKIGDHLYKGAWGCDFIVDNKYRGLGIGSKLNKAYYEHFQVAVHISMDESTRRMWERCGSVRLKEINLYWYPATMTSKFVYQEINCRIRRHKYLSYIFDISCKYLFVNILLVKLANAFGSGWKLFHNKSFKSRTQIKQIYEFNKEFDDLSNRTAADFGAIVKRDSKLLCWKFLMNEQLKYHIYEARVDNKLRGYIVLRKPHPAEADIGQIVDFYAARDDTDILRDLFIHAINFFSHSVSMIQCLTSVIEIKNVLSSLGFMVADKFRPLMLIANNDLKDLLKKNGNAWFFTLADHDLDQVRPG